MKGGMSMRRVVCAAALIGFMGALDAAAGTSLTYGHLRIETSRRSGGDVSHGYASHRIHIQNRSPVKTHRIKVRLEQPWRSGSGKGRLKSLSKTVEVAPNSTADIYIHQPYLRLIGDLHGYAIWVDGEQVGGRGGSSGYTDHGSVGSFAGTPTSMLQIASITVALAGVRRRRTPMLEPVNFIPRDILEPIPFMYSGLDGILLTLSEAEALSGSKRKAVWEYVKSGGSLAVIGEGKLPDEWKRLDERLENRALKSDAIERYEIGFGLLFLTSRQYDPTPTRPTFHAQIYDSWKETQQTWMLTYTSEGANAVLPVIDSYDAQASYRRMFFLMLLLAALIGPVNIFLFRRIDRRMKLYWTVPAVSLLACILVIFYAAVADGGKRMRVCSLTYLDQGARSASTIGWFGFYSPSAHREGLLFDEETELALQASQSMAPHPKAWLTTDPHAVGSVDWTDGQRWSGEWIKPRIPLHFKFRKIQERTERIDLKRDGGKLKAVNRLGADVKAFWYADHEGKLYQASDIRNGADAVLTETKGVQIGGKTLRQLYISQDWVPEIEAVKASPAAYLQPGRYIAELEENVFVENAMQGAKMKPPTCLVVGELEQGE